MRVIPSVRDLISRSRDVRIEEGVKESGTTYSEHQGRERSQEHEGAGYWSSASRMNVNGVWADKSWLTSESASVAANHPVSTVAIT